MEKKMVCVLRRRGFTLVEIMIGVSIIAFLAAIAVPTWLSYRDTAHDKSCAENKGLIVGACNMHLINTGKVETDLSKLSATDRGSSAFHGKIACPIGGEYKIAYDAHLGFSVTCTKDGNGHEVSRQ